MEENNVEERNRKTDFSGWTLCSLESGITLILLMVINNINNSL